MSAEVIDRQERRGEQDSVGNADDVAGGRTGIDGADRAVKRRGIGIAEGRAFGSDAISRGRGGEGGGEGAGAYLEGGERGQGVDGGEGEGAAGGGAGEVHAFGAEGISRAGLEVTKRHGQRRAGVAGDGDPPVAGRGWDK